MLFAKGQLQTTTWKNTKINCMNTGEFPTRYDYFQEVKPCLAFFVNPFNVNVVGDR